MPKREAEEYITKEHGSSTNQIENTKVKMATAAQLAKRKIAAPKSRLNRAPTPTGTGANAGSNPFAPQPSQSQPPVFGSVGGIQFGSTQSQSFPPGVSAPSGAFNFSAPGGSSSFSFPNTTQTQASSNPFSNMNGNVGEEQNKTTEDTVMESPQKKPAFGSGLFGSSEPNKGGNLFGAFGTAPTSTPSFPFGHSQTQPMANGFTGFGSTLSKEPASSTGQSVSTQPNTPAISNPFAAKPAFGFGASAEFSSNKTSPADKPLFSFGQAAQSTQQQQQPPPPSTQANSSPFKFGETSGSTPSAFANGTLATQTSTNASTFGQPITSSASSPNLFPSSSTPATNSASVDNRSVEAKQSNSPAFGSVLGAAETPEPPAAAAASASSNPFAGLFSSTSTLQNANVESTSTASSQEPKKIFNFSAPTTPQNSFGSRNEQSSTPSTSTLFASAQEPAPKSSPMPLTSQSQPVTSPKKAAGPHFGQAPVPPTSKAAESPGNKIFNFDAPTPSTSLARTPSTVQKAKPEQGTKSTQAFTSLFTPSAPATFASGAKPSDTLPPSQSTPSLPMSTTAEPLSTQKEVRYPVYTNAAARIPRHLDAEQYKAYDSNYRLHSLNREFQRRIASADVSKQDLENVVRSYVAARESIGASIGLYTRVSAGTKRKDHDEDTDDNAGSKRPRQATSTPAQSTPARSQTTSSIFEPVPSSSTSSAFKTAALSSKPPQSSPSAASSMFQNMIPSSDQATPSGSGAPVNPFASLSATSAGTKSPFTFGAAPTTTAQSISSTPPSSPPKKAGLEMPTFLAAPPGTSFMAAFGKQSQADAKKLAEAEKAKRKAEEYDSEEDDLETWEKNYEEEQRQQRSKIESIAQSGFTPSFGTASASNAKPAFSFGSGSAPGPATSNGIGSKSTTVTKPMGDQSDKQINTDQKTGGNDADDPNDDSGPANGDDEGADEDAGDDDDEEEEEEGDASTTDEGTDDNSKQSIPAGKSLFDRITPASSQDTTPPNGIVANGSSSSAVSKSSLETPTFSPITPAETSSQTFVPSKTFNFTPIPTVAPTPTRGASIFSGGTLNEGKIPGEGLFGSRSNTPVNGEAPRENAFGGLAASNNTPANNDHTWKKGSQIKFGDSEAPALSITEASPAKDAGAAKPFANLFGLSNGAINGNTTSSVGFGFGSSSATPATTLAPGFLGAASHLVPGSGTASGLSSRATSPGATDNESVATNETDDVQIDPQTSLLQTRPGEENENVLFESRVRAMRFRTPAQAKATKKPEGWTGEGLGQLRVLEDKDTGKARIVLRADPAANIIINANLSASMDYKALPSGKQGSVSFPIPVEGSIESWSLKVKSLEIAKQLSDVLEKHKKGSA